MGSIMIICDSVATCVNKSADFCRSCVNEGGTTWQDVAILGLNYVIVLCIAFWIINGAFKMGLQIYLSRTKRAQDENDRIWKQKADLKNRLLDLQKDYAEKKKDEHGNNVEKYDDKRYLEYTKSIIQLINDEKLICNNNK